MKLTKGCTFFLIILLNFSYVLSNDKKEIIFLNEGELIQFERIVEEVFYLEHFLYPICGFKPVAYTTYKEYPVFKDLLNIDSEFFNYLNWITFKNNLDIFCNNEIILVKDKSLFNKNYSSLFIINKKEFLKCCIQNQETFKQYAGSNFDPNLALKLIEDNKTGLLDLINKNELLLGILLGYGKQNSEGFYFNKLNGFPHEIPRKNRFELHKNYKLDFLGITENPLSRHNPIAFAANLKTKETKHLLNKYITLYQKFTVEFNSFQSFKTITTTLKEGFSCE